ncbi:hypothetical protein C8D87_103467 [Lentzea atacamensis]|uniref:YbaB/EbfC DNA-binding family protein n=1 Tax=Lentzea atacamensis TaxID=531938 RepID=A0ABX9EB51_9PSEU|nr:hypothetical protein C8D87_103467 [Lentzea atacamensis]
MQRDLGAGVVQDVFRDRVTFGLVGVQQGVRRPAADLRGQLPAEVDRVLDAQVQVLSACEEGVATADRRQQAKEWAEKQVAAVRGTAQTEHGDVRATVDHSGLLQHELSPITKQAKQDDLARAITAVVRQATADVRNQLRDVYMRRQNEGVIRALPPFLLPAPETGAATLALPVRGNAPSRRAGDRQEEGPPEGWLREDPW